MQKPYTLIIPSWYPTSSQPLNGIFIEKHVEAISSFENVVVMYVTGAEKESVEEKKISGSYVRYSHFYAESSSRFVNQMKYVLSQKKAYAHITAKYGKPSVLHLQVVFPAGIFVYLLLLFRNIPLIITEHWSGYTDEDGRYQRQMSVFKYLTKVLFAKAKKISVVSNYLKNAMVQKGLANEKKLMIVSNMLNTADKSVVQEPISSTKALYIGNLNDHEKNITMLIEAVEIVVQRYPNFELTLIGGGSEIVRFKELAAQKELLDKHIFFKGYVPNTELSPYYQANSFFILTSNFETFNIAAAEAMLCGLPVVATQCGGPAEFVNEHTGIWIKEKTTQETATAIITMIEKRSSFDSKSIATEVMRKYSHETIIGELKDLYQL